VENEYLQASCFKNKNLFEKENMSSLNEKKNQSVSFFFVHLKLLW
jgi:hypothetical protein